MIVYLDQNKWIELARMLHEKDTSPRAARVLRNFEAGRETGRPQIIQLLEKIL